MSAAQLLLRALSAFALSTSIVVVAQAPAGSPAAAPAGSPASHGLKPEEVENINVNSKVATHNAKVAKASADMAQNALQKTKKNIRKISEAHKKIEKVASNIKYIYPKGKDGEEEEVKTPEQPARAGAHQASVLMLVVALFFSAILS
eukprot:gnl/MRDRNA2_/MRDRNA2_87968_c0_seq1.p1 gnl/MRDRNA2_/MRDRNA2_87968_c0~~gnl/MRDRNA2_/MRDRNA2_87968_c0_seq1.p1  ORF type:complete len:147 (+),score=43.83 gnl/MRDRNA2_/MRDRNA2_87968_c0_seq1:92-532(+)